MNGLDQTLCETWLSFNEFKVEDLLHDLLIIGFIVWNFFLSNDQLLNNRIC